MRQLAARNGSLQETEHDTPTPSQADICWSVSNSVGENSEGVETVISYLNL